ncbi:MAG: glucose-1-phosphate cytidylyltransferase [Halobacteriota archaeon]
MKVVILCGGLGTRLREETEYKPKPMVEIGHRPILWHIMKIYSTYGFNDFILCLGYKGEMIKDYFYHYKIRNSDFTIELGNRDITFHNANNDTSGWKVTLVDTGKEAMTGSRIKRVEKYVDGDIFMVTYGDGVTDMNINRLLEFHKSHGKTGTVTGVYPPSRYGELKIVGDTACSFREKPQNNHAGAISGGYFVFNREFFDFLSADDGCVFEREPLERLAEENQLKVYHYKGFWQCMDTYRDLKFLNELWESGKAPWRVW